MASELGDERLQPPSTAAQQRIAVHLAEEHGIDRFRLTKHVYLGGSRSASQLVSWNPEREQFRCLACPGRVFGMGEVSDAMVERALSFDQRLQLLLVGVSEPEERLEVARAYLRGELSRPLRKGIRHRPAAPRPAVEHRRSRVQQWMLSRYAERGVLERVIEEALELQRQRPEEWALLSDRTLTSPTLRRYWQLIPDEQVAAAKALYGSRS